MEIIAKEKQFLGHQRICNEVSPSFISMKSVDFDPDPELSLWPVLISSVPFSSVENLVWGFLPPSQKCDLNNIYKESTYYQMTTIVCHETQACLFEHWHLHIIVLLKKTVFSKKSTTSISQVFTLGKYIERFQHEEDPHRAQKAVSTQTHFIQIKMH